MSKKTAPGMCFPTYRGACVDRRCYSNRRKRCIKNHDITFAEPLSKPFGSD